MQARGRLEIDIHVAVIRRHLTLKVWMRSPEIRRDLNCRFCWCQVTSGLSIAVVQQRGSRWQLDQRALLVEW